MPSMKSKGATHYFSVEGETEKWYLEHLNRLIRNAPCKTRSVTIVPKHDKSPKSCVQKIPNLYGIEITHVCDVESRDDAHRAAFHKILSEIKAARCGKVNYHLGYSNYSFELWILLHKADFASALSHRDRYLPLINKAYGTVFPGLADYKKEANFKRLLEKIHLQDVIAAIERAKRIMSQHEEHGHKISMHAGISYCDENPALSIHESIEAVLRQCGLM